MITLNAVSAAHAVNDYLLTTVGLTEPDARAEWLRHHPLYGYFGRQKTETDLGCRQCAEYLAAGPSEALPTREPVSR